MAKFGAHVASSRLARCFCDHHCRQITQFWELSLVVRTTALFVGRFLFYQFHQHIDNIKYISVSIQLSISNACTRCARLVHIHFRFILPGRPQRNRRNKSSET